MMQISVFLENVLEGIEYEGIELKEALARLKEVGLQKVYANYDTMKQVTGASVIQTLRELDLGVEGLYGFFDFPHHPMDDSYRGMIDLAKQLQAKHVLVVPGLILGEDLAQEEELKQNMYTGLRNAVAYGKEVGVLVSIEDFDGLAAPYCSVSGMADFLKNVPGLQVSFDTGNFVMYHDNELAAFHQFRDKICTIHLKDRGHRKNADEHYPVVCADGEELYAVPVGDGFIQLKEILEELKESGYDGGLIAELYGYYAKDMLEDLRRSVKWVKQAWK